MSVEPDKSAGCPAESDKYPIVCGDCANSDNVVSEEKSKIQRTVHFPDDTDIVTQYFEPANPWHDVPSTTRSQLAAEYLEACTRHNTPSIDGVLEQIRDLPESSIGGGTRAPRLVLSECTLVGSAPADALEAVLRKVQFRRFEIDHAVIDDEGAEAIFDMIEYYESAVVVCISGPRQFGIRGWQAASRMIKKSAELSELEVTDGELEASHSPVLARSLRPLTCRLRALCLQRVALCGDPLLSLVIALKMNSSVRELRLGDNRLSISDASQLSSLLRYNNNIQLLDLSNNNIQDAGVAHLADALAEQATQSPPSAAASPLSPHRCQVGGHEARGLAFLVLWNNQLTRNCAPYLSKALRSCSSLCVLNIGRNALGSEAARAAAAGLGLVSLGLQASRLGPDAGPALAELLRHHTKLQRLDLRENRLGSVGLQAILVAMKENTTLTQIDLDETSESTNLSAEDTETSLIRRLTREIRTLCRKNEPASRQDDQHPVHRKISLTCHTACLLRQGMGGEEERRGRLRSPAPSPAPSPAGSPVPAPHTNSRFSVTRVTPERECSSDSSLTPTRPQYCHTSSPSSRFRVVQVTEPPQIQVHPVTSSRKTSSRFSVTRNYDTMYNPSPSPSPPARPYVTPEINPGLKNPVVISPTLKVSDSNPVQVKIDLDMKTGVNVDCKNQKCDVNKPILHTQAVNKPIEIETDNKNNVNLKFSQSENEIRNQIDKKLITYSGFDIKKSLQLEPSSQVEVKNKTAIDKGLQTDLDNKPATQAEKPQIKTEELKTDFVKLKESVTQVNKSSEQIEKLKESISKDSVIDKSDKIKPTTLKSDIIIPTTAKNESSSNTIDTDNVNTESIKVLKENTSISKSVETSKCETTVTSQNESKILNQETRIEQTIVKKLSEIKIETDVKDSKTQKSGIDICDAPNNLNQSSKIKIDELKEDSNPKTSETKDDKNPKTSEIKDLSDNKTKECVKTVTSDLKYSDVVKNTVKQDQSNKMKQIVSITEDLGNMIKEMRTLVKDNVPMKDIVLKKNKSESSLDSPDLEVSRLTEKMSSVFDSNSSLEISGSSMESLNEHNRTIQELDRRKSGVILSGSSLESDVTPINNNMLNLSVSSNDSVSSIFGKQKQIHDSLSSLEASVSSLDSGKQEKVMVTSADSGIEYSLQNPTENKEDNSSNEGTLTNNSSLKETVKKPDSLSDSASPKRASSLLDVPALKNKGLDRMRKISWVAPSSSFHIPKPEEAKPSHLEKLLSLFQHPSSIFSRSSASDDEKKSASNTPPRKDSTLSSSFWSWGSTVERDREEDSSEATDSTLSERVQVCFVDDAFSRKLDSKTPSTDTDNTLSEFQSFPQESENDGDRERVTVTTEDKIVQNIDLSVNSQDIDLSKNQTVDLVTEKEKAVIVDKEEAVVRPRSFAAVLKSSGSENSLDKPNSPDNGTSIDKLPSKVIRGIKENISPENTLTSSMTNTKTLAEELERQVKNPPLLEVSLKYEPKLEEIKVTNDLAPIATIEETDDIYTKIDEVKDKNLSVDSGVEETDKKDIDLGKDALSYLIYENRDFDIGSENVVKTIAQEGSLAQELKEAEIKEILDLSPELVIDEGLENPVFTTKEIIGLRTSPVVPERAKLKKSNSLEDLSIVESEKSSPKIKTIAFKIPESTTPRDIPERRTKLRTRSGSSPKSLPESLNKPCPLSKMDSILTKKKKKVSSLGKIARDSLLALNMSDEEIAEFRRSYKLTSVESLKSLESVSEDANSQSGNSIDSRCRACLRTSQESLMSLDSITEDCRCTDDCEKPGRSAR